MNATNAMREAQLAQVPHYGASSYMRGQYAYANSRYTGRNREPGSMYDGELGQRIEAGEEINIQRNDNHHIESAGSSVPGSRQDDPIMIDDSTPSGPGNCWQPEAPSDDEGTMGSGLYPEGL